MSTSVSERLVFLDRDDAFIADLLHRLRDHLADGGVAVGRDGADLGDLGGSRHRLGALLEILDDGVDCDVDTALQVHRVHAGGNRLAAFAHDRLRQHGCGGGAVACGVVGLGGDLAQHLRAHVFELVLEFDFLGDGDAVLGDAGSAEALLDHHIAALRAERHLHRVGEDIDAAQHAFAGVSGKFNFFGSHVLDSLRMGAIGCRSFNRHCRAKARSASSR